MNTEKQENSPKTISILDFYHAAKTDPNSPIGNLWAQADLAEDPSASRNLNITLAYVNTDLSIPDIIDHLELGITPEGARQIIERVTLSVWAACSEETQRKYPLAEINHRKNESLRVRAKRSRAKGGPVAAVWDRLQQEEHQDIGAVINNLGTPRARQSDLRRYFRHHGFVIPSVIQTRQESRRLEIEMGIDLTSDDDSLVQEALNNVTIQFYNSHSKGDDSLLISLRGAAEGFYYSPRRTHLFAASLQANNIPIGKIEKTAMQNGRKYIKRNYFISRSHLERARAVLNSDPALDIFKIRA